MRESGQGTEISATQLAEAALDRSAANPAINAVTRSMRDRALVEAALVDAKSRQV
jgi:hypothetical protein